MLHGYQNTCSFWQPSNSEWQSQMLPHSMYIPLCKANMTFAYAKCHADVFAEYSNTVEKWLNLVLIFGKKFSVTCVLWCTGEMLQQLGNDKKHISLYTHLLSASKIPTNLVSWVVHLLPATTEGISTLVDESFQPRVEKLPSLFQNKNHFLCHLQELQRPFSPYWLYILSSFTLTS